MGSWPPKNFPPPPKEPLLICNHCQKCASITKIYGSILRFVVVKGAKAKWLCFQCLISKRFIFIFSIVLVKWISNIFFFIDKNSATIQCVFLSGLDKCKASYFDSSKTKKSYFIERSVWHQNILHYWQHD